MKRLLTLLSLTTLLAAPVWADNITSLSSTPSSGSGGGSSSGSTSTTIAEMPIVSEAMLDAYALSLINRVSVQMWEESSQLDNFYTTINYVGKTADPVALAAVPGTVTPRINLVNPTNNSVSYYVEYIGMIRNEGWSLFYGNDTRKPFYSDIGGGAWRLPIFELDLHRSDWIPWFKKGLINASMTLRDEDGKVIGHYSFDWDNRIDRNRGILYLGSQHVNRHGELYIRYNEGNSNKTDVINLATGKKIAPIGASFRGGTVNFTQVQVLAINSTAVTAYADKGEPGLFYVEYTKATNVLVQWLVRDGCPPGYICTPTTPVKVYAIDADDLADGPEGWHQIDLGVQPIDGPRRLFFRFESGSPNTVPIPFPDQPPGKGGKEEPLG